MSWGRVIESFGVVVLKRFAILVNDTPLHILEMLESVMNHYIHVKIAVVKIVNKEQHHRNVKTGHISWVY